VINNAERYLRVKNASRSLRHGSEDDPKDLAVFSCNFSGVASEADCAPGAGCVGAVARRVRRQYVGEDEEDRLRLRDALLRRVDEDGQERVTAPGEARSR
jgi:hypothetical protein